MVDFHMMNVKVVRVIGAAALMLSLSSCNLLTAPLRLLSRTASGLLRPVGGLGGAASLAPLLLDAKDNKQRPVRGIEMKLEDKAPTERVTPRQELVKVETDATDAEG